MEHEFSFPRSQASIMETLSPRQDASSGCGWKKWSPDMECSCECTEQAVADSRQVMVLQNVGWAKG
jgi:hypothetical protein